MSFDWADFTAPLDPYVLAMALVLGVSMGWVIRRAVHALTWRHAYWQVAGGVVFFVPLALLRGWQGSDVWERFAATLVLWVIFVVGMRLGGK
jgi:hypothetical protein